MQKNHHKPVLRISPFSLSQFYGIQTYLVFISEHEALLLFPSPLPVQCGVFPGAVFQPEQPRGHCSNGGPGSPPLAQLKKWDLLCWKTENFRYSNLVVIIILINSYLWMVFPIYFWIFVSQTEVKCKSKRQRWILVSASSVPVCLVKTWIVKSSFA